MALEAKKRLRWPDWADPAPPSLVWYRCKACPFPERSLGLGKGGTKPQSRLWGRAGAPQAPSLTACLFPIPGLKGSQVSQMRKPRLREAKDSPGTTWSQTRQGYQPGVRAGSGQPLCSPRRPVGSLRFLQGAWASPGPCPRPRDSTARGLGGLEEPHCPPARATLLPLPPRSHLCLGAWPHRRTDHQHARPDAVTPTGARLRKRPRGHHRPSLPCPLTPLDLGCWGKRPLSPAIPSQAALTSGR